MKRNLKAVDLVKAIQQHGVITGYAVAGQLAGEEKAQPQDWGQVCSLVDYAAFIAGLPSLTLEYVRSADGEINEKSYQGIFAQYKDEALALAKKFVWTDAAYTKLITTLLTDCADLDAKTAWQEVVSREYRQPGFIRYQLDRATRAAA